MPEYVVTGGTGFVGSAIVRSLQDRGRDVAVASRARPATNQAIQWIEYDLRDDTTIANIIAANPKVIVHCAWSTNPTTAETSAAGDLRHNLAGTVALMQSLCGIKGIKFIFASSGGTVYGEPLTLPIPEMHRLCPISAYGLAKSTVEHYGSHFATLHGLSFCAARLSNPFGPNQNTAKMQGAIPVIAKKILLRERVVVWGDGEQVRDYIDLSDASDAFAKLAEASISGVELSPAYNIGSGQGYSINQLISLIAAELSIEPSVEYVSGRPFDVRVNILGNDLIKRDVGFALTTSVEASIGNTVDLIRKNLV